MGLGVPRTIDLNKYLEVLKVFADSDDIETIRKEFDDYGIRGKVTFYTGSKFEDGEVLIPFTYEGTKGFLRFNKNGSFYEGLKSRERVGYVAGKAAELFVGGLYGTMETPSPSQPDYINILRGSSCWYEGSKEYCDIDFYASAKKSADDANFWEEQAREAERQAKMAAERAEKEAERAAREKIEMEDYIRRGDALLKKAAKLIEIATEEDGGPGGIDPDDLSVIRNKYAHPRPTSLKSAKAFYESVRKMFREMVRHEDSGYVLVDSKKEAEKLGCEYEHTKTGGPLCGDRSISYPGFIESLTCGPDGVFIINESDGGCQEKPERPPPDGRP